MRVVVKIEDRADNNYFITSTKPKRKLSHKNSYTVFQTTRGWMGILVSPEGILAVTLPQTNRQQAFILLGEQTKQAAFSPEAFNDIRQRFQDYYSGKKTLFPIIWIFPMPLHSKNRSGKRHVSFLMGRHAATDG